MAETQERFNVYMDEDVAVLMRNYCQKHNKSYSKFINEVMKLYFQKNYKDTMAKTLLPQEEKLNEIINFLINIQETVNASYRSSDYSAYLNAQKADEGLKASARKKVQKDFNALMSGNLTMEEYLKEKPVTEYVYETVKPEETSPVEEETNNDNLFVMKHKIQPSEIYMFNHGVKQYNPDEYELPDGYKYENNQIVKAG